MIAKLRTFWRLLWPCRHLWAKGASWVEPASTEGDRVVDCDEYTCRRCGETGVLRKPRTRYSFHPHAD